MGSYAFGSSKFIFDIIVWELHKLTNVFGVLVKTHKLVHIFDSYYKDRFPSRRFCTFSLKYF